MSADPRLVEAALVVVAAVLASLMVATLVLTAVSERVRRRRWAARGA